MNYKNDIVKRYNKYNLTIGDNRVEINNPNGDNLFIDLDDEITISFGDWHQHFMCEDRDDYEMAMDKVDNIISNNNCILAFYYNDKLIGCGSSMDKDNYSLEDVKDFVNSFWGNISFDKVMVKYWDNSKDYVLKL